MKFNPFNPLPMAQQRSPAPLNNVKGLICFLAMVAVSGCATQQARTSSSPSPKPNVNLSGFPPAFKEGYADGCASAKAWLRTTKDEQRFKADTQYAQGWRDGYDICKRR